MSAASLDAGTCFPAPAAAERGWRRYGDCLLLVALISIFDVMRLFSLTPPNPDPTQQTGESSIANVLLWIGLLGASLPIVAHNLVRWRGMLVAAWPLLLLLAWCWASIVWSIAPAIALRRVALETIVIFVVFALAAQQRRPDELLRLLALFLALLLPLEFIAAILRPKAAITELGWQGLHPHKNTAGAVAMIALIALGFSFLGDRRVVRRLLWVGAAMGWLGFLVLTRSKTSLALAVPAVLCGMLLQAGMLRGPRALAMIFALLVIGVAAAIVPFGFMPASHLLQIMLGDATFTGRSEVWTFLAHFIARAPVTGVGFGSFWQIGPDGLAEKQGFRFVMVAGEGHNGYLDVAATLGYVGLALLVGLFVLCAYRLFSLSANARALGLRSANFGVSFAFLVVAVLHDGTESSFLRGAHPVWIMALFAIAHICLAAREEPRLSVRHSVAPSRGGFSALEPTSVSEG